MPAVTACVTAQRCRYYFLRAPFNDDRRFRQMTLVRRLLRGSLEDQARVSLHLQSRTLGGDLSLKLHATCTLTFLGCSHARYLFSVIAIELLENPLIDQDTQR